MLLLEKLKNNLMVQDPIQDQKCPCVFSLLQSEAVPQYFFAFMTPTVFSRVQDKYLSECPSDWISLVSPPDLCTVGMNISEMCSRYIIQEAHGISLSHCQ